MIPDASAHRPDAAYLRSLVRLIGASQATVAERIGCSPRQLRNYLATDYVSQKNVPYAIQFSLESWAAACVDEPDSVNPAWRGKQLRVPLSSLKRMKLNADTQDLVIVLK